MENIGITQMKKELKILNPNVQFDVKDYCVPAIIYGNIPAENLRLPKGYYHNDKNGINNKHRTTSGIYECFDYQYDVEHFAPKSEPKKSFFARLFAR